MQDVSDSQIKQFVEAAHRVAVQGLVTCSSGDLSWRIDGEHLLVTASKAWLGDLTPDGVALCRLSDGAPLTARTPSAETRLHAGILRARPKMLAVLHFQSPCATAIACCDPALVDYNVILEVPFYIGPVATVPYLPAGSAELADAVVEAMRGHDLAMLCHHGQVTVGRDLDDALQRAVFFELACQIILLAGDQVRALPPEAVAALRRAAGV